MFKDKIRAIDIEAIVKFGLAWPIAAFLRKKNSDLWLVSERHGEARDNGYWMFKYIKENHPGQTCFYVIDANAADRAKINKYGSIITFGSFKHYVTYLLATKHISAHIDSDSPNSRVSNFLETHGWLKNKRIFLQHGITKDKISFGYYNVSRADLFVCAAKPEYEFCKKEFGYPDGAVQLLGFARFDGLGNVKPKRQILLMPTWRSWLAAADEKVFLQSTYYKKYQELINSSELNHFLHEQELELVFFPHADMQKFIHLFKVSDSKLKIADAVGNDVQRLLNESMILITDYSSVAFDMAYMNRPVLYYQFDYDQYRAGQHPEGYFSYNKDGFGPVVTEAAEVIDWLQSILWHDFTMQEEYCARRDDFFAFKDRHNCQRIYNCELC